MKLCKDCKHFRRTWYLPAVTARCAASPGTDATGTEKYYVTGAASDLAFCQVMRLDICGPDAKLFEPKESA